MTLIAACFAMATAAATYEENLALSRTPTNEITAANAEAIVDACIAVTNGGPIAYCRDKKLVSCDKIIEKLAGHHIFAGIIVDTALISSNDVLRTSTINMLVDMAKTDPTAYNTAKILARLINCCDETNYARRQQIANQFFAGGFVRQGTAVAFEWINFNHIKLNDAEYASFLRQHFDNAFNVCVVNNTNEDDIKWFRFSMLFTYLYDNGKNFDRMLDGVEYVINYYKQPRPAQWFVVFGYNHPFCNACRRAYLSASNYEDQLFTVACVDKKALGTTTALEGLYSKAKKCKTKVDCALELNDVDKLIDTFKTIDDTIDAKTMDIVIMKFNAVNAGYRTEDLKLALKNINKKYTLKLYDNHDTWEPILAKVRAMIETL